MDEYRLQEHADALLASPPAMRLQAADAAGFERWRQDLLPQLRTLVGVNEAPTLLPTVSRRASQTRSGYREEHYCIQLRDGVQAPLYVLTPDRPPPHRPLLVLHGHLPSIQRLLGNDSDPADAERAQANHDDFARRLAQAGYLVVAPEQRGFGSRVTDQLDAGRSCRHLAFLYAAHGRSLIGERVEDARQVLAWMQEYQSLPITVVGHSGGSTVGLWLAVLEEAVAAALLSGYLSSFAASIHALRHCECNYLPGLRRLVECGDLAALIAPRPLAFLNGRDDSIFPIAAARCAFATVAEAYRLCGDAAACRLLEHPGRHRFEADLALAWLAETPL